MRPAVFARRAGFSPGTVSDWLNGNREPSSASAERIADALGADLDAVLVLTKHRPATEPIKPDDQKARIIALVKRVDLGDGKGVGLESMLRAWVEEDRAAGKRG